MNLAVLAAGGQQRAIGREDGGTYQDLLSAEPPDFLAPLRVQKIDGPVCAYSQVFPVGRIPQRGAAAPAARRAR